MKMKLWMFLIAEVICFTSVAIILDSLEASILQMFGVFCFMIALGISNFIQGKEGIV